MPVPATLNPRRGIIVSRLTKVISELYAQLARIGFHCRARWQGILLCNQGHEQWRIGIQIHREFGEGGEAYGRQRCPGHSNTGIQSPKKKMIQYENYWTILVNVNADCWTFHKKNLSILLLKI